MHRIQVSSPGPLPHGRVRACSSLSVADPVSLLLSTVCSAQRGLSSAQLVALPAPLGLQASLGPVTLFQPRSLLSSAPAFSGLWSPLMPGYFIRPLPRGRESLTPLGPPFCCFYRWSPQLVTVCIPVSFPGVRTSAGVCVSGSTGPALEGAG